MSFHSTRSAQALAASGAVAFDLAGQLADQRLGAALASGGELAGDGRRAGEAKALADAAVDLQPNVRPASDGGWRD